MSWDEWLAIVVAWICSMKWAYSLGQKQSILLAAQLLEQRLFRNRWPTE